MKDLGACSQCHFITDKDTCPKCSGSITSDWQGYIIVIDHTQSEMAKWVNVDEDGKYALKIK